MRSGWDLGKQVRFVGACFEGVMGGFDIKAMLIVLGIRVWTMLCYLGKELQCIMCGWQHCFEGVTIEYLGKAHNLAIRCLRSVGRSWNAPYVEVQLRSHSSTIKLVVASLSA